MLFRSRVLENEPSHLVTPVFLGRRPAERRAQVRKLFPQLFMGALNGSMCESCDENSLQTLHLSELPTMLPQAPVKLYYGLPSSGSCSRSVTGSVHPSPAKPHHTTPPHTSTADPHHSLRAFCHRDFSPSVPDTTLLLRNGHVVRDTYGRCVVVVRNDGRVETTPLKKTCTKPLNRLKQE